MPPTNTDVVLWGSHVAALFVVHKSSAQLLFGLVMAMTTEPQWLSAIPHVVWDNVWVCHCVRV